MKADKRIIALILAVILIVFISSVIFIEFRIKMLRNDISEFTARNAAAGAILNGVEETVREAELYYSDIVDLKYDDNGNVKSINTDTAKLNTVSNAVNRNVDKRVSKLKSLPVSIPVTSFLGDEIFSGIGPKLTFYVTMTGSASTKFQNIFESTGVNQTRHQIMLNISVDVYVIFGRNVEKYNTESNVCIAESIIVGSTPEALAQLAKH